MPDNVVVELDQFTDIDTALRTLKKKMEKSGTFVEMKRQAFYMKPSDRRRLKEAVARRKARKRANAQAGDLERDDKRWTPPKGNGYR